jgi:hypothetical protein
MAEFTTPTDIGNRALQHCGAEMMDAVLGFSEVSKAARQVSFVYGKLRRAELEENVWTFATRRAALRAIDVNTMLLNPAVWVASISYLVGSIVSDATNTLWISRTQNNLGNQPQTSPGNWDPYFGPLTATLFDPTLAYFAGELVYTAAGDGTNRVYLSLQSANSDVPATGTTWLATTTYNTNQAVTYLSVSYRSLIDLNINQLPTAAPAAWSAATTYSIGQTVYNPVDGLIYSSIGNGNLNNNPATTGGVFWTNTLVLCPWTTVLAAGGGSLKWLEIGGAEFPSGVGLTTLNVSYPIGSGPSSQDSSKNLFRLPAGYLRDAPQDPKAGSATNLGAPTNSLYSDWVFENDFIVTATSTVIVLRFVADVQDVTRMRTLFCEGLAASIAKEICEPMTQSTAKLGAITDAYKKVMNRAKTANAIEAGSEEPPMDDWLACRG